MRIGLHIHHFLLLRVQKVSEVKIEALAPKAQLEQPLNQKDAGMLGYISLMKQTVYLTAENKKIKMNLKDFDKEANTAIWEVFPEDRMTVSPWRAAAISFNYGQDYFTSELEILSQDHNEITTKIPRSFVKTNLRKSMRFDVSRLKIKKMNVKYVDHTLSEVNLALKSSDIMNMSEDGICIRWNRKNGLMVPSAIIKKISLKSKSGSCIFESSGVVKWVEPIPNEESMWKVGINFSVAAGTLEKDFNSSIDSQRCLERIYLNGGIASAYLNVDHPLREAKKLRGTIHDITTHGCSILQEHDELSLPVGTVLKGVDMQIPFYHLLKMDMVLRHISVVELGENEDLKKIKKYGFEFVNMKPEIFKHLSRLVLESKSQHLKDADIDDMDEVWRFFFETGFIYDQKRRALNNKFGEIKKSYELLLQKDNTILKKIVYRHRGKIYAHVSSILHYESTWLVQHLAAVKNNLKSTSIEVVVAMIDFFIQMHNELKYRSQYTQFYYRPDNFYPSALFGGATKLMGDSNKAELINYSYYHINSTEIVGESKLVVADQKDLYKFESFALRNYSRLQFLAEGWQVERFNLPTVSSEYSRYGLLKGRMLLFNPSLGYVVYEYSNMGLNLSELTNVIKLMPLQQSLLDELAVEAVKWLKANSKIIPALLLSEQNDGLLDPRYFVKKTVYTCWTMDLEHKKEFKKSVNAIFSNLQARSKKVNQKL